MLIGTPIGDPTNQKAFEQAAQLVPDVKKS